MEINKETTEHTLIFTCLYTEIPHVPGRSSFTELLTIARAKRALQRGRSRGREGGRGVISSCHQLASRDCGEEDEARGCQSRFWTAEPREKPCATCQVRFGLELCCSLLDDPRVLQLGMPASPIYPMSIYLMNVLSLLLCG